jgi:hypothetical protein
MAALTFTIEPDEFVGLNALAGLNRKPADSDPSANTNADVIGQARVLMRGAGGQARGGRPALGPVR